MSADLRHIETWLFDLDNTLYPLESGLAGLMSARMTELVEEITGLPRPEALALQKRYLAEEGLTLRGLIRHHGVDPHAYHARFHDIPLDCLAKDAALRGAIARLPGRRMIFTNSDAIHTERVLEHLALDDLFEAVFHIGSSDYLPKPSPAAFERILAAHAINPATTAFFEDSERNLEPAAQLGMTTILVGAQAKASTAPFVRHRAPDLAPFLDDALITEPATP